MGMYWRGALFLGLPLMVATAGGCTSLLGDFSSGGGGGSNDSGVTADVGNGGGEAGRPDGAPDSSSSSSGGSSGGGDAGDDAPTPPPPPAAGKPGFDITSGGGSGTSTNYKLRVGALGEAPGGYVVGHSINYTLKGGVVAGTQ
jgi:hypothetical protein